MPDPLGEPTPIESIYRARMQVDDAQSELRSMICRAFHARAGFTVDDIAEAAGLSRPRIYQIVKEAKKKAPQ